MKTIHPSGGEAASRRGCSVWTAVTAGGSSCRSDPGGEGTGYWVWKAAGQRERSMEGYKKTFHLFSCKVSKCGSSALGVSAIMAV